MKATFTLLLHLLLGTLLFCAQPAAARPPKKTHVVKSGDSIAKIADFYGVSQRDLMEINRLKKDRPLKLGQKLKIPNVLRVAGKTYKVKPGDSLGNLAKKFNLTAKKIAQVNKIRVDKPLKVGRTLVIPDNGDYQGKQLKPNKQIKPIRFLRVRTGERQRLQLYRHNGSVNKQAVMQLSRLARDKIGNKVKRLNYRLIEIIQKLALAFPNKPIEIISGYRADSKGAESQHAFGRAMDLRIKGISGKRLFQFCRSLPRSGCGLYPKSGFVHMDAREKKAFWIDNSP